MGSSDLLGPALRQALFDQVIEHVEAAIRLQAERDDRSVVPATTHDSPDSATITFSIAASDADEALTARRWIEQTLEGANQ